MLWFYYTFIDPVLLILYVPLDRLLGWLSYFPAQWALAILGLLSGLAMNIIQKYLSNQPLLGRCKEDMAKLKAFMAEAKKAGDKEKLERLKNLYNKISSKYALGSMKPVPVAVLVICIVFMWASMRLAYKPIRPGETVEIIACLEDGAKGAACILPEDGIEFPNGPVSPVSMWRDTPEEKAKRIEALQETGPGVWWNPISWFQKETPEEKRKRIEAAAEEVPPRAVEAQWLAKPLRPGNYTLTVCYDGESHKVKLPVGESGVFPPDIQTFIRMESPSGDKMQMIGFTLKDSMPASWWNLHLQWIGVYLIVAIASGFGLRPVLGVK